MVQDPYAVLGIDKTATKDEIKSAYRKAAKKYHPDLHPDDPDAAKKMNEVNEAYDMLMNPEKYANQNTYADPTPSYSYSQYGSSDGYMNMDDLFRMFGFDFGSQNIYGSSQYRMAEELINRGSYAEAIHNLESIQSQMRSSRWYYLYALANEGAGNHQEAVKSIQAAVAMEPQNMTYQQLYSQLSGRRSSRTYQVYTSPGQVILRFIGGIFLFQLILWILQFLLMGFAW